MGRKRLQKFHRSDVVGGGILDLIKKVFTALKYFKYVKCVRIYAYYLIN